MSVGASLILAAVLAAKLQRSLIREFTPPPTFESLSADQSDYEVATGITDALLVRAQSGDPAAQYSLGLAYASERDGEQATHWMELAAAQGHALAANDVGHILEHGDAFGVGADVSTAVEWYKRAADLGEPMAHLNLAEHYRDGVGLERNEVLSTEHFALAAKANIGPALCEYSHRLELGVGGPIDKKRAAEFRARARASERQSPRSFAHRDVCCSLAPDDMESTPRPDALVSWERDQVRRFSYIYEDWNQTAYELARHLRDKSKAKSGVLRWVEKFREQYDFDPHRARRSYVWLESALPEAGCLPLIDGEPVGSVFFEIDMIDIAAEFEPAYFQLFSTAARNGHAPSQLELGFAFENGDLVDQDLSRARYWYSQAAEQGERKAVQALRRISDEASDRGVP